MSSSRKKLDEKNLKTLRDLASLPPNKYCFDCNQRGPTYVNVTIGSFVCTKCSGLLRGITPPHRVKSISMTTFTSDEIELLKNRGNEYCRRTWLGLYEGKMLSDCRDEQVVRDLIVDKYERKRYYLEPSASLTNGIHPQQPSIYQTNKTAKVKPLVINSKLTKINGTTAIERNKKNVNSAKLTDFVADFGSANIYNAMNANRDNNLNNHHNNNSNNNAAMQSSFANFDNSVIFNSSNAMNNGISRPMTTSGPPAPSEDRYAALKDLDNALKEQPQIDWTYGLNGSSFGSGSITSSSSIYSSPSPHGSMYGSPSQGQFASIFSQQHDSNNGTPVSNPFNNGSINWNDSGNQTVVNTANPFRQIDNKAMANGTASTYNGTSSFPVCNGVSSWAGNPFSMGTPAFNGHSNNPFL